MVQRCTDDPAVLQAVRLANLRVAVGVFLALALMEGSAGLPLLYSAGRVYPLSRGPILLEWLSQVRALRPLSPQPFDEATLIQCVPGNVLNDCDHTHLGDKVLGSWKSLGELVV